jgi:hypothetical protein
MPKLSVPAVESSRISAQEPFHSGNQIPQRRFHYQMKVIAHQTIGVNLPLSLGTSLAQGLNEPKPILLIGKDGFLMVPSIHDVVDGSRILHSNFACHRI